MQDGVDGKWMRRGVTRILSHLRICVIDSRLKFYSQARVPLLLYIRL